VCEAEYAKACFDVFSEAYLRELMIAPQVYNDGRHRVSHHVVGSGACAPATASLSPAVVTAAVGAAEPAWTSFPESFQRAITPNTRVIELDVSGCWRLSPANFPLIALCCPKLEILRMIACSQVGGFARALVVHCCCCYWCVTWELRCSRAVQLTPRAICATLSLLPNLLYINLDYCSQVDDSVLFTLARRCPNLSRVQVCVCQCEPVAASSPSHAVPLSLQLSGCTRITDAGIVGSSDGKHIGLARGCVQLRRLLLRGCTGVGNDSVLAIATHCSGALLPSMQRRVVRCG
jgi:hypothetical protein